MLLPVFIVCIIVFFDQVTKYFASTKLKSIDSITIINNILDFKYIENRGAAFGVLDGGRWFFVLLTIVIISVIFYYYKKLPGVAPYNWVKFSLLLIIGGALGNFIDRALNGYVVDFIHATFIDFPIFNIADICVVVGAFLLAFMLLFVIRDEDKEEVL